LAANYQSSETADEGEASPTPPVPTPTASGTKLQPRAISAKEGATFAKENGLLYVETSAKEGWGVVDAFERTAKEALRRHNEDELARRKVRRRFRATWKHEGVSLMSSRDSNWTRRRRMGEAAVEFFVLRYQV